MRGSVPRRLQGLAYNGAMVIALAGAGLGLAARGSVAYADGTATNVSVPATAGPAAGAGTDGLATAPVDTGLSVGSTGITFVTFSADTSAINLRAINDNTNVPVLANGNDAATNTTYAYGATSSADAALPSAPFGALLYRIGTSGAIQQAPFVAPSLGPTTIALPAGHDTGDILLFVNDNIYGDNTGSYSATVSVQTVAAPTITKAFSTSPATSPVSVVSGQPTTLTFTITNPPANTTGLSAIAFTDNLLGNLTASGVQGITVSGASTTCAGGTVTTAGNGTSGASLSLAGATLAANASCTVTATVVYTLTSPVPPQTSLTNTTSAGTFSATVGNATSSGTIVPVSAPLLITNGQQVANNCSLVVGLFGTDGTQLQIATGKLLGGRSTLRNDLALRGPGGVRLLAVPVTSSVTCLLPFISAGPPAVRLPTQVDFNATVISSSVVGIVATVPPTTPTLIHVTIKYDPSVGVESVTITNLAGTTTYYSFTPSNTSVAPRTFVINAQAIGIA